MNEQNLNPEQNSGAIPAAEGVPIDTNDREKLLAPSALEAQLGLEHLEDTELRLNRAETILAALLQEFRQVPSLSIYGKKTMEIPIEKVDEVIDQFRSKKTLNDREAVRSFQREQDYYEACD